MRANAFQISANASPSPTSYQCRRMKFTGFSRSLQQDLYNRIVQHVPAKAR
jgi:hypothetical protein